MEEKLKIMLSSDVIDKNTHDFILEVKDYLEKEKLITTEIDADMFLTHLAMADMRMKNLSVFSGLDASILSEISTSLQFKKSQELWENMKVLTSSNFSEDEQGYIFMHLINLLDKQKV